MTTDDAQLISQVLNGDAQVYGDLVLKYQDRLFTSMVHVVGNREEAEDCVQDAFVQAFLKLPLFRHGSTFYTWLYRIAFNTAVSRRRRRRGPPTVEQPPDVLGAEPLDPRGEPGAELERAETVARIHAALAQLDEDFRAVLVLRELEGCDYETIGEILELSPGTVRSRLHRARARLRAVLEHPEDPARRAAER